MKISSFPTLALLTCIYQPLYALAFTTVPTIVLRSYAGRSHEREASNIMLSASGDETPSALSIDDKNGAPITEGSIVRVAVENLKAYHSQAKGRGSFNETKEFVAAAEASGRATKCLVLPVGMRGVVTRVFDKSKLSCNFPIQVKFEPGKYTDEGIDPPTKLTMHFGPREVECI